MAFFLSGLTSLTTMTSSRPTSPAATEATEKTNGSSPDNSLHSDRPQQQQLHVNGDNKVLLFEKLGLNSACAWSQEQLWQEMLRISRAVAEKEPFLTTYYHHFILSQANLIDSLATVVSYHLASVNRFIEASELRRICIDVLRTHPEVVTSMLADLNAVLCRDPAARDVVTVFLYFKGFQSIQAYRVAHALWGEGRHPLALMLQSLSSMVFSVDIHPAARVGNGLLIDHAHSVVIGETAVVGENCSIFHEVTLGGTGKEQGDRHPKIGNNVLIGAGAKVFGNITVGDSAKIAGGSVVLQAVPPFTTVAGIPAKVIGKSESNPASNMNMNFFLI